MTKYTIYSAKLVDHMLAHLNYNENWLCDVGHVVQVIAQTNVCLARNFYDVQRCRGTNITKSYVNNIPHKEYHIKEQYTEEWKDIESWVQCWTENVQNCIYMGWLLVYIKQEHKQPDWHMLVGVTKIPTWYLTILSNRLKLRRVCAK